MKNLLLVITAHHRGKINLCVKFSNQFNQYQKCQPQGGATGIISGLKYYSSPSKSC